MTRRTREAGSAWLGASGAIVVFVLAPLGALGAAAAAGSADLWSHLFAYVLSASIRDTLILLSGVGVLSVAIGVTTAWLVTAYDFPGRRVVDWALFLPLAVPTYIVAYAYLDILHPVSPLQTALRALLGFDSPREFRLPDVRSMAGCIVLLSFVLYPYVYLTTRAMFLMQSANLIDVARALGAGRTGVFVRVALPLARPAIVVGLSLVLLETLNDIGASEFLGVRTLTVSIYTTWVTRSDLPGAAQMALAMIAVALAVMSMERWARRRRRYANDAQHPRPLRPHRTSGIGGLACLLICLLPIAIGFVIPAAYLVDETLARLDFADVSAALVSETITTVLMSAAATIATLVAGVVVAYTGRTGRGRWPRLFSRLAAVGYAVPGTVLAIGVLLIVTSIESITDAVWQPLFGASAGLFLLGTGVALVYAYGVRFLALASGGAESGFDRVSPRLDEAARSLGERASGRLRRIYLPLARPALATAALLVFVDCMKELPATLLLRPLGVETLATHLYGEAARGTYEEAAIAALLIVFAGLVPVIVLARLSRPRADAAHARGSWP